MKKHTKETHFKIVGYPEWWEDFKQKNRKAATVVGIPQTTSNCNGDTRREEEAKPQVVHGRAVVTHGGKRREEDTSPGKYDQWIFYCRATDNMTHDPHDFNSLPIPIKTHIETASGELVAVQGEGSIVFSKELKLENCFYVPALSSKLLSIRQVTKELNCGFSCFLLFAFYKTFLRRRSLGVVLNVEVFTTLMRLLTRDMPCLLTERLQGNSGYGIDVWIILHLGTLRIYFLVYVLVTLSPSNVKLVYGQRIIVTFPPNNNRVNSAFSLVHSDVWGPAPNSHNNQFQYFLLFVDDFSRMTWVYFLKHKYEVPD